MCVAQPVTYLSLALTLATGVGVTAYYLHLKEKRLKSAPRTPCAARRLLYKAVIYLLVTMSAAWPCHRLQSSLRRKNPKYAWVALKLGA